ncbi:MAG: ABC transporter ATP-binding protein [Deltaproteobacteria bacterium]|nr:ABC transporter ATP-binding protein [Candidatus Anaeroferrophillus wilburensis]MBN2887805.1 ABC transporter ATP-binding protein [Deltaproteobacteria bacterium]
MTVLKIEGLTQHFSGLCALSDFNVQVGKQELVGLIGPNGAGKTTVFNVVSGFYQPTRGTITFFDQPIAGLKPHQVTTYGIARTFQNIRLWNELTVLENISLAQHGTLNYGMMDLFFRTRRYQQREREIRDLALELLEIFKLSPFAGEKPKNLPYGLQRKVEIARALSSRPQLLLLDEPAAGLNSKDIFELIDLIQWIFEEFDLSIWMIEHQMKVVMSLCSRITVIDFGETIAEGTPEEIQNNPEVIKAYLGDDLI